MIELQRAYLDTADAALVRFEGQPRMYQGQTFDKHTLVFLMWYQSAGAALMELLGTCRELISLRLLWFRNERSINGRNDTMYYSTHDRGVY